MPAKWTRLRVVSMARPTDNNQTKNADKNSQVSYSEHQSRTPSICKLREKIVHFVAEAWQLGRLPLLRLLHTD